MSGPSLSLQLRQQKAQMLADELPTHPLLGRWIACLCGHPTCERVSPSRIGTFYQGTGFSHAEAKQLVFAMKKTWRKRT